MSVEQEQKWITAAEFGREWRELVRAGVPEEAPEFQQLMRRVNARDNELFERYGRKHLEASRGKWIAISLDGRVIIRGTAGEVVWAGTEAFGVGNFTSRKLEEFPGHKIGF